jgi:DNA-directed RNA polymerase specialized sigma24 family protein
LSSRDAASDVLQIAFLRAVKSRRRFKKVENPVAYLFQIGRNEAMRWAKRHRILSRPLAAHEILAASGNAFGQQDDAEIVTAALGRLSRRIVSLWS